MCLTIVISGECGHSGELVRPVTSPLRLTHPAQIYYYMTTFDEEVPAVS